MTERPPMIRPYISDAKIGDGYRTAFVLKESEETTQLYVPSLLAVVTVPRACVEKARRVGYRPRAVRANLLSLVRCYRRHGRRFPRKATVQVLRLLGAARTAIDEVVTAEPLPKVAEARARRAARAERAPEVAAVVEAIRAKVEYQAAETKAAPAPRPQGRRRPCAHPDQLTLAL